MSADTSALSGSHDVVGSASRPLEARGAGRRCSHPDCQTKLSRYNPDETCTAHGGWSDATVKRPGRKPGCMDVGPRTTDIAEGADISDMDRVIDLRDDGEDRVADQPSSTASNGSRPTRQSRTVVLTAPSVDMSQAEGSTAVVAELSLEPSLDSARMQHLLRRVGHLLAHARLEVRPRPAGVVVAGDLSTIMEAVEQVHRLASRHSKHMVTTVKIIGRT